MTDAQEGLTMRFGILLGLSTGKPFIIPWIDRSGNGSGFAIFWLWFDLSIYYRRVG
jgi:hypothetical protein